MVGGDYPTLFHELLGEALVLQILPVVFFEADNGAGVDALAAHAKPALGVEARLGEALADTLTNLNKMSMSHT